MFIDGKLPQGDVVICSHDHPTHSFLVRRLGLSVECPGCGCTALSTDLAAAFLAPPPAAIPLPRRLADRAPMPVVHPAAMTMCHTGGAARVAG